MGKYQGTELKLIRVKKLGKVKLNIKHMRQGTIKIKQELIPRLRHLSLTHTKG